MLRLVFLACAHHAVRQNLPWVQVTPFPPVSVHFPMFQDASSGRESPDASEATSVIFPQKTDRIRRLVCVPNVVSRRSSQYACAAGSNSADWTRGFFGNADPPLRANSSAVLRCSCLLRQLLKLCTLADPGSGPDPILTQGRRDRQALWAPLDPLKSRLV